MLNIHFTLPMVVKMLRTIAEREPNRVGREDDGVGCTYASTKDGVLYPICIVGQMFADLGLLRLLLENPSDVNYAWSPANLGACSTDFGFWVTMEGYGITADEDAQRFMRNVQMQQDGGDTWSEAFQTAVDEWKAVEADRLDYEQNLLDAKRQALSDLFA